MGVYLIGMPHILLRFMAIEDENELPMARRVGSIWVVISMTVAIVIVSLLTPAPSKEIQDEFEEVKAMCK